jgi:hypothetical protein
MKIELDTLDTGATVVNFEHGGYFMLETIPENNGSIFLTVFDSEGEVLTEGRFDLAVSFPYLNSVE